MRNLSADEMRGQARAVAKGRTAAGLALLGASAANAQPAQGTNKPKGWPVEDEHGNMTYVSEGTRIGLSVCGSDGEWHFGWLITGRQAPQQPVGSPTGTLGGVYKVSV